MTSLLLYIARTLSRTAIESPDDRDTSARITRASAPRDGSKIGLAKPAPAARTSNTRRSISHKSDGRGALAVAVAGRFGTNRAVGRMPALGWRVTMKCSAATAAAAASDAKKNPGAR